MLLDKIGSSNRLDTGCNILADSIISNFNHVKPGEVYGPQRNI